MGYSPLIVACNIGNCAVVRLLLNHGAELEDADPVKQIYYSYKKCTISYSSFGLYLFRI